jgi:hypothetical protein
MSGAPLRLQAGPGYARTAIDGAVGGAPLVILTNRMVVQLEAECGGTERAALWLLKLATRRRRPIGLHDAAADRTVWIAPPDWSGEKLIGYVLAHREALESVCGPVARWHTGASA